ncbi:MAG: APC family permease, partial [Chloroflexi bacterium]|nr:APC family permease [Chloroflexota bacterium]
MEKHEEQPGSGLKRSLGLLDTVSIEVGAIIGAGIFALTGMAVARCGPGVPVAFLIAAIPMVLALLPVGMLASVLPTVGGSFRYPSRILNPFWGFIGVWGIMMGIMLGGMPMYALNFADYLRVIFPAFDRNLIAVVTLTFFFVINVVGVKSASVIQVGMFFVLIAALLVYIIWGIPAIDTANLTPLFGSGWAALGIAAGMLFFAYMGANFIIDLGAEIKDAGRNIPRSFAISMPIVIVIYTLMGLVTVGSVPLSQCANQPLSVPAGQFMPPGLALFFTVGGGLLALATTINATFMFASRYIMVFAEDEVFPRALAGVNRRFGTPHWGLLIMFILSIAFLPMGASSFEVLAYTASIGSIVLFFPILISAMRFPRKMPEAYARAPFKLKGAWLWIVPVTALLFGAFFIAALVMGQSNVAAGAP